MSDETASNENATDNGGKPKSGGQDQRFRAPSSGGVDVPGYAPEEDEAVNQVAKRFRSGPRIGSSAIQQQETLDQKGSGGGDVDENSLLDALDSKPSENSTGGPAVGQMGGAITEASVTPAADEELPQVEVQPVDEPADEAPQADRASVCPSCQAENPQGMKFCVQCGGSLKGQQNARGASRLKGEAAAGGREPKADNRQPPPPSELAEQENPWDIQMISINEDGSDGKSIPLEFLETTVGREGDRRFPTDAFLSPKHARLHIEDGQLFIEDLYSLNGTFIKLQDEKRLTPGDTILMGRQVLRFERFEQTITPKTTSSDGTRYMGSPAPGGNYKILQVGIGDVIQNVYCLPEPGAVLGREKGDIVFPHDKFMSGRHAQIYPGDDGHCYLVDLNSSNGTWTKIWEKTKLDSGDYIFMGQQLFRVQYD